MSLAIPEEELHAVTQLSTAEDVYGSLKCVSDKDYTNSKWKCMRKLFLLWQHSSSFTAMRFMGIRQGIKAIFMLLQTPKSETPLHDHGLYAHMS